MKSINLLVADPQPIFVEGLRCIFSVPNTRIDCQLNGVARSIGLLHTLLVEHRPDMLLFDISLPDSEGVDLIPILKRNYPHLRIVVITMHNDPRLVKAAIKGGADAYLLKTTSKEELITALEEVSEGHTYLGRGVCVSGVAAQHAAVTPLLEDTFAKKYHLTRRELEIMRHIGLALTNKEIGDKLYISDQTVSVHRKNIMRKLRVNSTASLIRIVFENHLVESGS